MSRVIRFPMYAVALALTVLGLVACSENTRQSGKSESAAVSETASVTEFLTKAESTYLQAQARGHGWNVTADLIQQANQARQAGDGEQTGVKARQLAERALATARASLEQANLEQANTEEAVWQARFRESFNLPAE